MIRTFYIAACRWLIKRMPAEALDHAINDAYQQGRDDERNALNAFIC